MELTTEHLNGRLPSEWTEVSLGDVADLQVGYAFKSAWFKDGDGVRLLRGENVGYGVPDWSETRTLPDSIAKAYSDYVLVPNDIVIGMDRTFTKSGTKISILRESDCPCLLVQRVGKFVPRKCDPSYLRAVLTSESVQAALQLEQKGMDIPHLSRSEILSPAVPLPPVPEQRAIAAALSDVDELIGALEKLIAKKRAIKLATMQQLLTGKTRLPGFSGEWVDTTIGNVIESCSSGATPYRGRTDFYRGKVRWITSGELKYGTILDTAEHISEEAVRKTNLKIHPPGTFLMAITGLEAEGTRGSCGIVGDYSTTNQSCMAIYPTSQLRSDFLFHYYSLRGKALALQYCQGTKQQSYTAKTVRLLPITMPVDVLEQQAIADVLADMNAEITTLEQRRDKTKAIKQGMMQALLTGRVRLVDPGMEAE